MATSVPEPTTWAMMIVGFGMVGVGSIRVLDILSNATNVIAEGEVLQLMNCHDPEVDEGGDRSR